MMCAANISNSITAGMDVKFFTAGCMATAIVHFIQRKGECLPQDLYGEGFSTQEVREYWHMAESLAAVELRLSQRDEATHA